MSVNHTDVDEKAPKARADALRAGPAGNAPADESFPRSEIEGSVGRRFEQQVALYPGNTAIRDGAQALTYTEFNQAANRIANRLLEERGHKAEQIGIFLPLCIDSVVAHMAVFKTGKCCVSLDPFFPEERLRQIVDDAQVEVILCRRADAELVGRLGGRVPICIDDAGTSGADVGNPAVSVGPDAIASIIYTSGSTGKPKGVLQSHRFMLHRIWSDVRFLKITPSDRQALVNSMSFAAAWPDALAPLLNGATSCPFDLKRRDPLEFVEWMREAGITILNPPITAFRQLMQHCSESMTFPACRAITFAGEAGFASDADIIRRRFSEDCRFICQLASSETMLISRYEVNLREDLEPGLLPVGEPEPDREVFIVDGDGNELPRGEIGTIVVRSRYLSSGYWRRPDLNDDVFSKSGDAWTFRSSDTGRIREDGMLEHRGRADFVVKLRGYRVDFTEVEAAILSTKLVKAVAVGVTERPAGRQVLVAYAVENDGEHVPSDELRRKLAEKVPDYMVPSVFVYLDDLPRTFNGKLNRLALPEVSSNRPDLSQPYAAPTNELETRIVEIWQDVLGVDTVGIDDEFVDLGGDSLSLVQLHAELETCLGRDVPVEQLIRGSTVRHFAESLQSESGGNSLFALSAVAREAVERRPLFCIYGLYLYKPLAEALAQTCPVYGIYVPAEFDALAAVAEQSKNGRSTSLDDRVLPTVEGLADLYIEQIRSVHPHGPYQLLGSSFGGVVAFEIARRLADSGEDIRLVAMLDSFGPGSRIPNSLRGWVNNFRESLAARQPLKVPPTTDTAELDRVRAKMRSRAERRYRPHPAAMDAVLIRAETPVEFPGYRLDPQLGWKPWVRGQLHVFDVPGDHLGILRPPNVDVLAEKISGFLDLGSERQPTAAAGA